MSKLEVKVPYKHKATGNNYLLLFIAKYENNQQDCAVYQGEDSTIWVRPMAEFEAKFERIENE